MAERAKVCDKSFIYANGDEAAPTGTQFKFVNGQILTVNLADLDSEMVANLTCHGIGQKVGDAYAGAKGNVDEAIESASAVIERLLSGDWAAEREAAGPSPNMVAEAVIAAKTAAGIEFDIEATRAKYVGKDTADARKRALENVDVKAHYERLRAEAAAQRAAKAAEAAKATAGGGGSVADL